MGPKASINHKNLRKKSSVLWAWPPLPLGSPWKLWTKPVSKGIPGGLQPSLRMSSASVILQCEPSLHQNTTGTGGGFVRVDPPHVDGVPQTGCLWVYGHKPFPDLQRTYGLTNNHVHSSTILRVKRWYVCTCPYTLAPFFKFGVHHAMLQKHLEP